MKHLFLCLAVSTQLFAADSAGASDSVSAALPVTSSPAPQPTPQPADPGVQLMTAFKSKLIEAHYHARRYQPYFTQNDWEIFRALEHLMMLCDQAMATGIGSLPGKECFYQMKQPMTYINTFIAHSPALRHVVSVWDQSLVHYQKLVSLISGLTPQPGGDLNPNDPQIKLLITQALELRNLADQFNFQMKRSLPVVNAENQGLLVLSDRFTLQTNQLYTHSLAFVTERWQMEQTVRQSIDTSRQISAGLMYTGNAYLIQSWEMVRAQANLMRQSFEKLMAPKPQ